MKVYQCVCVFALIKDKIMKLFAKQLVNKHELLRTREDTYDSVADRYIKLDQFLTTVGLESRTVKVRVCMHIYLLFVSCVPACLVRVMILFNYHHPYSHE